MRVHNTGVLKDLALRKLLPNYKLIHEILTGDVYFKFVFVRNPYLRLISAYENKINRMIGKTDLWEKKPKAEVLRALQKDPSQINQPVSFSAFVDFVTSQDPVLSNGHWRPQHLVIASDKISYDFIGRLENFTNDIEFCFSKFGFLSEISSFEMPERKKTQYTKSYSKELAINKNKIIKFYKNDFKRFRYDEHHIPDC